MKSATLLLFGLTTFLGAILLFSVEPMIGKMALPLFGGPPAVWNTCLVYFQVVLLCGYLCSGCIDIRGGVERRLSSRIHLTILGRSSSPVTWDFRSR